MSEVNNDVSGGEPIVKSGSSSDAVSFDDLEAISTPIKQTKIDKNLEVDASKDGKKDSKSKKQDDDPGEPDDDDAKSKEKKDDKKADTKVDKEKQAEADKNKPKVVKFKNGDADLEVPANAKVTVKVNGKEESFDLQEVLNEFSGKTDYGRKYQELDKEKRSFHAEKQELQGGIDELFNLAVKENKPLEAISMLTEMLGGDGVKTVQDLQTKMLAQFEEFSKLTPEQKTAKQAQEEAQLYKRKLESRTQADAKNAEKVEVAKRVDAVKTKHNMPDGRFEEVYKVLSKSVKPEELTPELIGDVHERWMQMDQVDEMIAELQIENADAVKKALYDEWAKDRSLTAAQIKNIAVQVFGGKKSTTSKLKQKIDRNGGATNTSNTTKTKTSEPITFDDLD